MHTHKYSPGHRLDDRGLYLHYHHSSSSTTKSSKKPPTSSNDDDTKNARNPDVARAVQVASFMGLHPVGWVVARPGGVAEQGGADGGGFLNGQEVVVAARLQVRLHLLLYIMCVYVCVFSRGINRRIWPPSASPLTHHNHHHIHTQIEALREAGRAVGDGFLTLAVNTTGEKDKGGSQHSVEAFQVGRWDDV